jgi:hypothetical protein
MTTKQTISVFLHASPPYFDGGPYSFTVFAADMTACGYIPLGRTELEFDIPSHEQIVARHTVLLREKIKEVYQEAERQTTDLRNQLAKLEALTYTAPASDAP